MSDYSATYNVYSLSSDGSLSVDGASLVGQGVEVSNSSGVLDSAGSLTALGFDGPFDGGYAFVSRAVGADGADGFIAKDSHGHNFFFTEGSLSGGSQPLSLETGSVPICFMEGTFIATPQGERAVETLQSGDEVFRADGGIARVRWVGRQAVARVFARPAHLPICLRAGALADQIPSRDLYLSPCHAVRIDDLLVQAGCLINGTSITRMDRVPPHFTYYHVETEDHCLIIANGTPAETFIDNVDRAQFDNWEQRDVSWQADETMTEMDVPRVKAGRQLPPAMRDALDRRGRALWSFDASHAA